jgi:histidinol-phosphate aminotransferase
MKMEKDFPINRKEPPVEKPIRMANNENPYGASPLVKKTLQENTDLISLYPPLHQPELKQKIAETYSLKPDNIGIAAGSVSFIDILLKNFLLPEENTVIPRISFVAYKLLAKNYLVQTKMAEMKNYGIDLNSIFELLDEKTRLVFLANPNNPTGAVINHDDLYSFLKKISPEIYVVIDEAYVEYVKTNEFPRSLEFFLEFENVIILRSFSKAHGLAGLRIGYAISNPGNIRKLESFKLPFSVTALSSVAAMSALEDKEFLRYSVENNHEEREFVFDKLTEMGFNVIPSEGNFLFIHFDDPDQRDRIYDKLMANGISTKKTDHFGDQNSLRVTMGIHKENERFILCLADQYHK